MIRALSFSKSYASKSACENVSLLAEEGKAAVLLGPNGAGKSTLLNALAGRHYATSGTILFDKDGALLDARENPLELKGEAAFVGEIPALYDDWTVREFLSMAALLRLPQKGPKKEAAARAERAAKSACALCSLEDVLPQKISSLSRGYRQRVNLAQALVSDPKIVILDEPTGGLDPERAAWLKSLVRRLKKGRAVILSTHIIQEAESLADTIYIMQGGSVRAAGTLREILAASGKKSLEEAYLFFASGQKTAGKGEPPDSSGANAFGASSGSGGAASNDCSPPPDSSSPSDCPAEGAVSNDFGPSSGSRIASASRGAFRGLWRLVQKEAFAFFISPLYWILAALFFAFCAAAYFYGTRFFVRGEGSASLSPFFLAMPPICSVFFPALCMNIKSRAFDQGLPYGEFKKAAARVLSALLFFTLCLLPTLLVPLCVSFFGSVDPGVLFTAYLGLLFFAAASLSFCVFLSAFFKSRAACFAFCVLALAAVNSLHRVLNYLPLSDFLSSLVRAISFAWRFDAASKGVLDSRDLSFFAISSLLFLSLSAFCSEQKKGKKYFSKRSAPRTWTLALIFLFLALDSSRLYRRIDFTRQKMWTPSERTLSLFADAEEKIRVSYYRSAELLRLYPQVRDAGDFLRSLCLSCPNAVYSEFDAAAPAAQRVLEKLSIQPFQMQKQTKTSLQLADCYSAVVIDYMDKTLFIPAAFSAYSLEYDLNARLDLLVRNKKRFSYVLCANGMALQSDFANALAWLEAEGFELLPLAPRRLSEISLDPKIPLVLFGTKEIDESGAAEIKNFLDKGGSLFAAAGPYALALSGDWSLQKNKRDYVLPILEKKGISFAEALAADVSCVRANFRSADSDGRNERNVSVNYPLWINAFASFGGAPAGVSVFWASPLSLDESKAAPLLLSSPASWVFLPDKKNPGLLFDTNPFSVPKSAVDDPLVKKERSVLAARTLDDKISVVSGDLFANDLVLSLGSDGEGGLGNLGYLARRLLAGMGDPDMAALKDKGAFDFSLWKISDAAAWERARKLSLLANFVFAPVAIFLLGALFFFERRRRNEKGI